MRVQFCVICDFSGTSSAQTGSFWNNFALENHGWLGWLSAAATLFYSQHFSFLNVCFPHLGFSQRIPVPRISFPGWDGKPGLRQDLEAVFQFSACVQQGVSCQKC